MASSAAGNFDSLQRSAVRYVSLVLATGIHCPEYLDAYYGPAAWRHEVEAAPPSLADVHAQACELARELAGGETAADAWTAGRRRFLAGQTRALVVWIEIARGRRFAFDEESRLLYDAVAPIVPLSHYGETLAALERLVPGDGPLRERYALWRAQFEIARPRLDGALRAAIAEARSCTKMHIELPEHEAVAVEYVGGKVWNAYNWYQGNARSRIEVNTDNPWTAHEILRLACHEAYPGHHVYNTLLQERLYRERGWAEFSVCPLYAPQALIAEGTADYGVDLVFPREERIAFFESVLFPRAGLDPAAARAHVDAERLVRRLHGVLVEAARAFVDCKRSRQECVELLETYALLAPARAEQRMRFIEKNRSYMINYVTGEELVRAHVPRGTSAWQALATLLSSPVLPSDLRQNA